MNIKISKLKFKTIIGILPFERVKAQNVIVNLTCSYIYKDNHQFVDYSKIVKYVKKSMRKKRFELLEDAIIFFEKNIPKEFAVDNLRIEIVKPDIIKNCKVSLSNIE